MPPAAPESGTRPRILFCHIMKTAGTTLLAELRQAIPPDLVYPPESAGATERERWDRMQRYTSLGLVRDMPESRRLAFRLVAGHFPFAADELLRDPARERAGGSDDLARVTLLRDPVARTISMLGQLRRDEVGVRGQALEGLYDDPWIFDRFISNHQTRMLSMSLEEALAPRSDQLVLEEFLRRLIPPDAAPEDRRRIDGLLGGTLLDPSTRQVVTELQKLGVDPEAHADRFREMVSSDEFRVPEAATIFLHLDAVLTRPSPVDAGRLDRATRNLERCGALGVTEDFAGFVVDLNRACGLDCETGGWGNRGDVRPETVPTAFRRRIADDNAFDLELYERARQMIGARHG